MAKPMCVFFWHLHTELIMAMPHLIDSVLRVHTLKSVQMAEAFATDTLIECWRSSILCEW
jgi:hypothetical protein